MNKAKWIKISLFNLLLVAFLGVILRYKIVFSLPFIQQKHLLHAHSHFAFSGWISMIIMFFIVSLISDIKQIDSFKKYNTLLIANVVTAYGMLISFSIQGYGLFSISFSTLSIVVSYFFGVMVWKDLKSTKEKFVSFNWIKAAIIFNVISSLGAFSLAYLMVNKIIHQNWYLAAIYFFLHFQYNGWFLFSVGGFTMRLLEKNKLTTQKHQYIFYLFAFACLPAYFLSALWMNIPLWIYILVILAAMSQFVGWCWFLFISRKHLQQILGKTKTAKVLFTLSAMAFSIKLILQLGSTIPFLSTLAFGYRPIVIGYLHLALLGVITLFLLAYLFYNYSELFSQPQLKGSLFFASAVILNELVLMIQGVSAILGVIIPYINEALFVISLLLFCSLLLVNLSKRTNIN